MTPPLPPRRRRHYRPEVAVVWAAQWARGLVDLLGMRPGASAALAARRYGVTVRDVLARLPSRSDFVWVHGTLVRATRRPSARARTDEATDEDNAA